MSNDIKSSSECLKAVDILFEELKNAKRSLMNSESCIVNRGLMQAQLEYLRNHLPDTVKKAAAIVEEEETIRNETESKQHLSESPGISPGALSNFLMVVFYLE